MMKAFLAAALFLSPAFAQDQLAQDPSVRDQGAAALAAAGCGSPSSQFDVKTDKQQHPLPQAEPGKAIIVLISQNGNICVGGCITEKVGVDGAWVGANRGNSYFFFAVEPGEHRVCTAQQSILKGRSETASAFTFTAEEGKIYYVRKSLRDEIHLHLVDNAEGPLLIKSLALSTSRPKISPDPTPKPTEDSGGR